MGMRPSDSYRAAGVDTRRAEQGLGRLLGWLDRTFPFPGPIGRPVLPNGFFAAVHDLGGGTGIAISTDSPGTKLLLAQMAGKYESAGVDCVAVNVNDVLCVGARPIALVDYVAVQRVDPQVLEEIARGLYRGAEQAGVAIAGGEIAQLPEMIRGVSEGSGFDIAGTCVGVLSLDRLVDGSAVQDGDVVVGFLSSGVHCNGMTLARRVLLAPETFTIDSYVEELGCELGEELLRPALIYVKPVLEALARREDVTGLAHITGDGFLNLLRLRNPLGYELDALPDPPPIFRLIQRLGGVSVEEMYTVYNMGIGFCAVVRPEAVGRVLAIAGAHGFAALPIGRARASLAGRVILKQSGLEGEGKVFRRM